MDIISRAEAKKLGLKWCWHHQQYEPINKFGKSANRSDGLQPLCRAAKCEQERKKRAKRNGFVPRASTEIKRSAPAGTKWCAYHKRYCELSSFGRDARKNDGMQSSCRRAQQELSIGKHGRSSSKSSKYNPPPLGTKWCWWHRRFEALTQFADQATSLRDKSGKYGMCKQGAHEYYLRNTDRFLAHVHTRRARKKINGGVHTAADITDILRLQRKRCALPTCRASLAKGYHIDHIVPLVRGGSNDRQNLQALCPSCNSRKGASDPIEFAQRLGLLL